ncbi:helix-turn-helix transcriptional regulator [Streptomyces sp. PmtG]
MGAGDLAELLRELKGRSGLSYGVLAKRLHVSTSTLHRYVNGTAVPTEFAPVERLARLCKATPDELMEVHRRWIVADATRGRKAERSEADAAPAAPADQASPARAERASAALAERAEAPPAANGPSASGAADPAETTTRPGATASEADASSDEAPAPAPAPAPTPASAAASPGAEVSTGSASPAAEGGPRAPSSALDEPGPARAGGDERQPRARTPRTRRRRLAALAAVGVVLALGGTALALHGLSGGSGGSDGDGKSSAVGQGPRGATEGTPSGKDEEDPSGKPSTTSSAHPSKKGGKGEDKDDDGAGAGGAKGSGTGGEGSEGNAPGSGGKASAGPSARAPLSVSTQPQHWDSPCGRPYVIPRTPGRLPAPPNEQDAAGWVSAFGAVSAEQQEVKFTVQGTGKETVVLESLNVRVVDRSTPPGWNKYLMGFLGVGCGGDVPKHLFNVELDKGRPALVPEGGDFPYKVSESDPEAFYVTAFAKSRDVRWYLELEWSSGHRHGTLVIDDEGKPFRTTAASDDRMYGYTVDTRKWVKAWRNPDGGDGYEWEK